MMVHDRLLTSFSPNKIWWYDYEAGKMLVKGDGEAFADIKRFTKKNPVVKPNMDASLYPKRQYIFTVSCGLDNSETWKDVEVDRYFLSGPNQNDPIGKAKMEENLETRRQYGNKAGSGLEDAETWSDVKSDRYFLPGPYQSDALRGTAEKNWSDILKFLLDPDQCDAFQTAVKRRQSHKTLADSLVPKRLHDLDAKEESHLTRGPHPEYRVLKYSVPRQDYGRLDYNAQIAQRICKELQNTDLHVPDIIKCDQVSFFVLVPKTVESDKLAGGEVMDVSTEWKAQTEIIRRWVILLPENDVPLKISEQKEMLYLEEKKVENLKDNCDVQRFITFSFENEIFAYAERAFKYVKSKLSLTEDMKQEQKMLRMINLDIRSLLTRKLPEHDTSAYSSPDEQLIDNNELRFPSSLKIKRALETERLQDCGIRGFCNATDGFRVFVDQPKNYTDRTDIADRIGTCCMEQIAEKPVITWVESIQISDLAAQGDALQIQEASGTLGCFGRREGNTLVAITAGHCASQGQTVHLEDNGIRVEFGICTASHDTNDIDIAIIDVNEAIPCDETFRNENSDVCEVCVYQGNDLATWPVHKLGAKTGHTEGVVYSGEAHVGNEEGIIINPSTETDTFAKPGDSGSIVFFYDPTDLHNKRVMLLSIVSKKITIRESGAIPEDLSRKPILTRSLRKGLDRVPGITV